MECSDVHSSKSPLEFLCAAFPQIDIRLVKATILEHGDDLKSAANFLLEVANECENMTTMTTEAFDHSYDSQLEKEARELLAYLTIDQARAVKRDSCADSAPKFECTTQISQSRVDMTEQSGSIYSGLDTDGNELINQWQNEGVGQLEDGHSSITCSGVFSKDAHKEDSPMMHSGFEEERMVDFAAPEHEAFVGDDFNVAEASSSGQIFYGHVSEEECGSHDFCDRTEALDISTCSESSVSVTALEDCVQDARASKESVLMLIDEIRSLRSKTELESVAAEEARAEADKAGKELAVKIQGLQRQIKETQENNLVRAGEIYGEKAVLASEARELRVRLEQVKQQKEDAVAKLSEIRVIFQERLDIALKEREKAELEKKLKEEDTKNILAMEEARLAGLVEESKKLDKEAECCTQLREYLIAHGSIVDSLQGEMYVLCEDIEAFKKQVEEGMWSSISTASSLAGHPEEPYSFRRSGRSSVSSSQVLERGQDRLHDQSSVSSSNVLEQGQDCMHSQSSISSSQVLEPGQDHMHCLDKTIITMSSSQEQGESMHDQILTESRDIELDGHQGIILRDSLRPNISEHSSEAALLSSACDAILDRSLSSGSKEIFGFSLYSSPYHVSDSSTHNLSLNMSELELSGMIRPFRGLEEVGHYTHTVDPFYEADDAEEDLESRSGVFCDSNGVPHAAFNRTVLSLPETEHADYVSHSDKSQSDDEAWLLL